MKVRVKEGMKGFFDGVLRNEGDVFTITPVKHSVDKDENGNPVIISVEQQFSKIWMEEVKTPGRKKIDKPEDDD